MLLSIVTALLSETSPLPFGGGELACCTVAHNLDINCCNMNNALARYRFESICDPAPEMREAVNVELRQFNRAANPHFYEALSQPENIAKPLHIFAFDEEDQICGGLFAETQFLWLKISIMAVREDCRSTGIGTRLMKMAEGEAVQRGCKHAFVDTMDYQAPNFYLKLGYVIVCHLDNWDSHGHSKLSFKERTAIAS